MEVNQSSTKMAALNTLEERDQQYDEQGEPHDFSFIYLNNGTLIHLLLNLFFHIRKAPIRPYEYSLKGAFSTVPP